MIPRLALVSALLIALAGAVAAAPDRSLADVADEWSVRLVTTGRKSGQPRSATIWFVHDEGRIYVQSGKGGDTDWYRNLLAAPAAMLHFDTLVVRGEARAVEDRDEIDRVHALFRSKYLMARLSSWVGGGLGTGRVVLIEPR